jgi:cytoskeletal protein RodZ
MRRRQFPIGLVGLLILMLSFIGWYSYMNSPLAEQHAEEQQAQPVAEQPAPIESADEVKRALAINQAKIKESQKTQPKPTELKTEASKPDTKPPAPPKTPNVNADARNNVVDYWWNEAPPKK